MSRLAAFLEFKIEMDASGVSPADAWTVRELASIMPSDRAPLTWLAEEIERVTGPTRPA
jgi:hypothetical protein